MNLYFIAKKEATEGCLEYVELKQDEVSFTISLYERNSESYVQSEEKKIRKDEVMVDGVMFGIYKNSSGKLIGPINMTKINYAREGNGLLNLYNITEKSPVILFYCILEHCCVITDKPLKSECPVIVRDRNEMPKDILADIVGDTYLKRHAIGNAKRTLLLEMNPNTSLAALEAQVDILTNLVLLLIEHSSKKAEVITSLPEFIEFAQLFADTSLLASKGVNACLNEMRQTKTNFRKLQADYYSIKGKGM